MTRHVIHIELPKDENGFIGRECLECKKYFKLKPGTGLPTKHCHCPYCEYEGDANTFFTPEQLEYGQTEGKRQAYKQIVEPLLNDLEKSMKKLEQTSRNSWLQIKVKRTGSRPYFPVSTYDEKELETTLKCDNCTLEFAIYGVFSHCPDCKQINAFTMFRKSLEVCEKQFRLFKDVTDDPEVIQTNLKFILNNSISAFDGLGKELRNRFQTKFPDKPKNLFQNIDELTKVLNSNLNVNLDTQIQDYPLFRKLFQVRHISEHNMGVIDDDFIKKVPSLAHLKGRKYIIQESEINYFLEQLLVAEKLIEAALK